jgi:ATP-dependent RNA helicase SUPV3L1/SUV3
MRPGQDECAPPPAGEIPIFDLPAPATYLWREMFRPPASSSDLNPRITRERGDERASRVIAALGPTNTGKTHLAIERMLGHASGMIGLPLRLLAREIYDRIVKARGERSVALVTGEEKIVPLNPRYWVCTVEAMPLDREVDFLAIDEIQLSADRERGHVFTERLLHARGRFETMFMGAATMAPLIRQLVPHAEIQTRERLSTLSYAGPAKLTKLPKRSAVVAFSAENVYAIAELIRRQRGGAAVVMGSLSPRTRNAQVELFQSGEVDFLVATDAIGMGLNMDLDHVAFAGLRKFDGRRTRWLQPQEIGQIGGRAGRYRRDGSFGVTGDASDMDPDVVAAVEAHAFAPATHAEWRNARLDFDSLQGLMRSLSVAPPRHGLRLAEEAQDETTLRLLAADELVARRSRDRANLFRLWEVCQTPDFRKITQDEHTRLVGAMFEHLTQGRRRLPEDWARGQFEALDRLDGDIDALSGRLARVRTLAYVAHRGDWLDEAVAWAARTRALEDRLSDTLHERLMQRFVDRRTSALMRGLEQSSGATLGGIAADGTVIVEGHEVGQLIGLHFQAERGKSALEARALRGTIDRAVAPEISRRLAEIAADGDEQFSLSPNRAILWRGHAIGEIVGGSPHAPQVRLDGELGAQAARARAVRRLEAFVVGIAAQAFASLARLKAAAEGDALHGLARGLAYQLVEAAGALPRREAEEFIQSLYRGERKALRELGVRFGTFTIFVEDIVAPETIWIREIFATLAAPRWRPGAGLAELREAPAKEALTFRGLRALGQVAAPIEFLERIGEIARQSDSRGFTLTPETLAEFGWSASDGERVLRSLGFIPAAKAESGAVTSWRRRGSATGQSSAAASPAPQPPTPTSGPEQSCRIDVWLWRARFCKTRALAAKRVANGEVSTERRGERIVIDKASRQIRLGETLTLAFGGRTTSLRVEAAGERRGPAAEAQALYTLLSS